MFGYPFKTIYLKSNLTRNELESNLKELTYLSDDNFKKDKNKKYTFYGEISNQDFTIETLEPQKNTANFITGLFRGVENDTFIILRIGALKHRRIFVLFFAAIATILGFLLHDFYLYPAYSLKNAFFLSLLALEIIMMGIVWVKYNNFNRSVPETKQIFTDLWSATEISKNQLPIIFNR